MLSRWPIRNKLLVGIALLVVILLTMSTSSFQGTYAYRELVRSISSRRELELATALASQVSDLRVTLADLDDAQAHDVGPINYQSWAPGLKRILAAARGRQQNHSSISKYSSTNTSITTRNRRHRARTRRLARTYK